jgi:uncharacterized membrane protein
VVLGSLDEARGSTGVPRLAVTVGGVLTVLCLFAVMFYVDKVARWIIADNIVEEVSGNLRKNIHEMLPEGAGRMEFERRMIAVGGRAVTSRRSTTKSSSRSRAGKARSSKST